MRIAYPLSILALLAACGSVSGKSVEPSGVQGNRSFPLAGFDKVSLRGSDDVIVQVGPAASVSARGDTALLDQLEIDVQNGVLRVGRKRGYFFRDGHATVTVTLPRLSAASVAGSGNMKVDRVQADSFDASVAGSGDLDIASLTAGNTSMDVAGSGDLRVAGSSRSTSISIAGSGNIDAGGLKGDQASISIAGSGSVRSGVDGTAKVSILGSGDVDITGKARCTVSKAGSGDVRCSA